MLAFGLTALALPQQNPVPSAPKYVAEEVATLRAEKAAAVGQLAAQKEQMKSLEAAASDAKSAVSGAHDMLKWIFGILAALFAIGAFSYVKVSLEDREKIREQVEKTILPTVREHASAEISQVLKEKVDSELPRIYRAMSLQYAGLMFQNSNLGRWGYVVGYALLACDASHRSGSRTERMTLIQFSQIIIAGERYFYDSFEEAGWNDDELDALNRLQEWVKDAELLECLKRMHSWLTSKMQTGGPPEDAFCKPLLSMPPYPQTKPDSKPRV